MNEKLLQAAKLLKEHCESRIGKPCYDCIFHCRNGGNYTFCLMNEREYPFNSHKAPREWVIDIYKQFKLRDDQCIPCICFDCQKKDSCGGCYCCGENKHNKRLECNGYILGIESEE